MRAIVSAHTSGEWSEISRITWPRFSEYASRHGATFYGEVIGPTYRPPAWSKLTSIAKAFVEADEVLWLDTDVLIIDGRQSIFDEVTDGLAWQSAVPHTCEQRGRHFNTGVWLLRRAMIPELVIAAMQDDCISHPWWEQAAIMKRIDRIPTFSLDRSWNDFGNPDSPKFFHACGLHTPGGQLEAIQKWSERNPLR